MRGGSSRDVLRHLRTLYRCGVVGQLGDEQLLDRFVARRDETAEEAFAELVQRHGPMVLGVCRRILGDAHEAEDAFQATFLVLARKAASVVRREKVANWLYGVAVRTAKEARGRAARRRAREERVSTPVHVEPPDDGFPHELQAILDEELARLPARYRGAVVLCELEGLSRPEAARRLGVPEGTLSSRLSRAKAQLRDRLVRRGVTLPIVTLSAVLLREARATSLPLSLVESTVEAATLVAAGSSAATAISVTVASLAEGVLKAMLFAKLKGIVLGLGTLTAVVSGAVVLAQSRPPAPEAGQPPAATVELKKKPPGPAFESSVLSANAALERKLDRILDALDRLSRTTPAPPSDLEPLTPPRFEQNAAAHPVPPPPPAAEPVDVTMLLSAPAPPGGLPPTGPLPESDRSLGPPTRDARERSGSIADRLQEVEERLQITQKMVAQLAQRLAELEKLVGGTAGSVLPPDNLPPSVRRSAIEPNPAGPSTHRRRPPPGGVLPPDSLHSNTPLPPGR